MNELLKNYIEKNILPKYIEFDKGHNIDHAMTVIEESLVLAKDLDVNLNLVYTIAVYHDLGLCKNRKFHHIVSGEILESDKNLKEWFSEDQILTMKEAVEDHRASSKSAPRSIYGRIVAEADRDIIPLKIIKRTIQYSLKHSSNESKELHWEHLREHMNEKYSEGGYMKLWFENSKNATKLKELRAIIADESKLRKIFEKLYKEEIVI